MNEDEIEIRFTVFYHLGNEGSLVISDSSLIRFVNEVANEYYFHAKAR